MTGVGTKRITNFVNNLPKFDYEPIILTVDPNSLKNLHRSYGVIDEKVALDVNCKKYYAPLSFLNTKLYSFLQKFFLFRAFIVFISVPDHYIFWIPSAYKKAKEIIEKENIEIVFSTAPPYSSHLIAYLLKKKFSKIRWVCDFRDEWTTNRCFNYITPLHYKINRFLEKKIIKNSDVLVTVTAPILNIFKNIFSNKDSFYLIENSYADDFYKINTKKNNDKLIITYTGSFYGKMLPNNLIIVIENLIKEKLIPKDTILLRFVGNSKKYYSEIVNIENIDFASHKKLKEYKEKTDLLLLILENEAFNVYSGKIFDYIATGIPILGLVPEAGVADKLIKESRTGFTCELENLDKIRILVLFLFKKWEKGNLNVKPNWETIKQYSSENTTKKLVNIIENLIVK